MITSLYLGIYEGRITSYKNGIAGSESDRNASYSKGGNLLTIYALCTHIPGLPDIKMRDFERAGKDYFEPYRQRFNKDKSEYLMYGKAPKNLPLLTQEGILEWYKNESKYYSGFYWVKQEYFPMYSNKTNLTEFMEKIWKDPKKYLENYK
jgi:hypothetical protein